MTERKESRRAHSRVVVLLTTWNRPALLGQSLPQIEREARQIGAPVVISDDQSDDPDTQALLDLAGSRGIEVIRRDYVRMPNRLRGADAWKHAHFHIQWNNLFAFEHVVNAHHDAEFVLKVDDDIVLYPGGFGDMLDMWKAATRDGHDILGVSGLVTVHESVIEQLDGYAITSSLCNAAVLYRRDEWERFVATVPREEIVGHGFDVAFRECYAPQHRAGARMVSVMPSVVYHTGLYGTHMDSQGQDINVNYAGSLGNVIVG
jgi:hypothetical protein